MAKKTKETKPFRKKENNKENVITGEPEGNRDKIKQENANRKKR